MSAKRQPRPFSNWRRVQLPADPLPSTQNESDTGKLLIVSMVAALYFDSPLVMAVILSVYLRRLGSSFAVQIPRFDDSMNSMYSCTIGISARVFNTSRADFSDFSRRMIVL